MKMKILISLVSLIAVGYYAMVTLKMDTETETETETPSRCKIKSQQSGAIGWADLYIFDIDEHEYFMFDRGSGALFVLHSESCQCKVTE